MKGFFVVVVVEINEVFGCVKIVLLMAIVS
jgi:hypothetical protein